MNSKGSPLPGCKFACFNVKSAERKETTDNYGYLSIYLARSEYPESRSTIVPVPFIKTDRWNELKGWELNSEEVIHQ